MSKKLIILFAAFLVAGTVMVGQQAKAADPVNSFNHWVYFNGNVLFSPSWSLHVMPGHSYEYWTDAETATGDSVDPKGTFLTELFIGPWYTMTINDKLKVKVGLEYYYMGFSITAEADVIDFTNHCVEFIPVIEYKINDKFSIASRTIFHNVLKTSEKKSVAGSESYSGWGLLARELITISYNVSDLITLSLGNEFFYGIKEAEGLVTTTKLPKTKGYNENRVIPGITLKNLAPGFNLTANYIWRTPFAMVDSAAYKEGEITKNMNYVQLIASYTFKTYE